MFDFKTKFDSKMTGEKKNLMIAKTCSYAKLTKKYTKVALEQIPWLLKIKQLYKI